MSDRPRVLVVGGGISGLAAALDLARGGDVDVEVRERSDRTGGKLVSSPFAGIDAVDEGADAYLTRVPAATGLVDALGLDVTSPTRARAAVWHDGLHDLPDGLVLGVPASVLPFARSRLLSWRGKLRAAAEPFLPATDPDDSIGRLIRARFGDEVHERLVDALVGSIYATDTDRSSLAAVPQLAALARSHRSLLVGARAMRRRMPTPDPDTPIFAAPRGGMGQLTDAAAEAVRAAGGRVELGRDVTTIDTDGAGWRVDGERVDAVVLATPASAAAGLLTGVAPDAAEGLATIDATDVVMVRMSVAGDDWPDRLAGRSGYLVPKPRQRFVTAVSFASQKWEHWRPDDGRQILRASLGRDGLPAMHLDDDAVVDTTVADIGTHLGLDLAPTDLSITRWHGAFPQYRPHHHDLVAAIEQALPPTIAVAGASYRGIGVPACITDGGRAADRISTALAGSPG